MGSENKITARKRNLIVAAVSILVGSIMAASFISAWQCLDKPFPGFMTYHNNVVGVRLHEGWTGFDQGIATNDIVVAVDGRRVYNSAQLEEAIKDSVPGDLHTYTVVRGPDTEDIEVPIGGISESELLIVCLRAFITGFSSILIGLLVFFLKPDLKVSRYILLYNVIAAVLNVTVVEALTSHRLEILADLAFAFIYPSMVALALHFPVERKITGNRIFMVALFASAVPVRLLNWPFPFTGSHYLSNPHNFHVLAWIAMIHLAVMTLASGLIMVYSFWTSRDIFVRQRAKVVIFGFVMYISLSLFTLVLVILNIPMAWMIPSILFLNASLAYAIVKHNLFDVDVFLRRSISYITVSGLVVALLLGMIAVLSMALQQMTGQSSQIAAVVSTLLMVVVFRPLRERVDRAIDRRFFREKYQYTSTIRKASGVLVSIIDRDRLLRQLLDTVLDAVKVERGVLFLKDDERDKFESVVTGGYHQDEFFMSLGARHPIAERLEAGGRAAQLNDIEELPEYGEDRADLLRVMRDANLVLVIPIIYERRLIGILGLGEKKSGAWYSSEDIELLQTLMIQTAVSIENARKVEELKKLVELETGYRELQRLDEMKDNFLSMVSHDLRTPMTSIKGYASILLKKSKKLEPDRQIKYLDIIINESDRLTRLINDLLDLQRFEAGKMKLEFEEIDLLEIVRESAASFRGAALAKSVTLREDLPAGEFAINADRDRLCQVLANLLSNAVKFTPEGGSVRVSAERLSGQDRPRVKVSVSDTGPGIPADKQASLFDKFQQVDGLVRGKEQGSGLGLALAREIMEHHGGEVGVNSEPDKGSEFYFVLDCKEWRD